MELFWLPAPKVNEEGAVLLQAADDVAEKLNGLAAAEAGVPKENGAGAGAVVVCDEGALREKVVEGLLPKAKVDDDGACLELEGVMVAMEVGV